MRISDWSSDVCSSDLLTPDTAARMDAAGVTFLPISRVNDEVGSNTYSSENTVWHAFLGLKGDLGTSWKWDAYRSEEHTSELQSLMRTSYAVFCLKKKNINSNLNLNTQPSSRRERITSNTSN